MGQRDRGWTRLEMQRQTLGAVAPSPAQPSEASILTSCYTSARGGVQKIPVLIYHGLPCIRDPVGDQEMAVARRKAALASDQ